MPGGVDLRPNGRAREPGEQRAVGNRHGVRLRRLTVRGMHRRRVGDGRTGTASPPRSHCPTTHFTWEPGADGRSGRARHRCRSRQDGCRDGRRRRRPARRDGRSNVDDRQRGRSDVGDRQRGRPDVGDRQRGRPDVGDRQRGRPDVGDRQRGRPDVGDRQRGPSDVGDRRRGRPRLLDGRRLVRRRRRRKRGRVGRNSHWGGHGHVVANARPRPRHGRRAFRLGDRPRAEAAAIANVRDGGRCDRRSALRDGADVRGGVVERLRAHGRRGRRRLLDGWRRGRRRRRARNGRRRREDDRGSGGSGRRRLRIGSNEGRGARTGRSGFGGTGRRRHIGRCDDRGGRRRGRDRRSRGSGVDDRGRRRRGRHARRQQRQRVDVALVVVGVPNTEMDVRPAHLGVSAGTDRPDAVALGDCRALRHHGRPQMCQRHRPAVAGLDRHRLPAARHGADEADDARCGRTNLLARIAADVDAAMLTCPVRVIRVEQERLNDSPARRPGPRPDGRDADERRQHDDAHDDGSPRGRRRTSRPCGCRPWVAAAGSRAITTSAQRKQEQQEVDRRGHRPANRAGRGPNRPGQDARPLAEHSALASSTVDPARAARRWVDRRPGNPGGLEQDGIELGGTELGGIGRPRVGRRRSARNGTGRGRAGWDEVDLGGKEREQAHRRPRFVGGGRVSDRVERASTGPGGGEPPPARTVVVSFENGCSTRLGSDDAVVKNGYSLVTKSRGTARCEGRRSTVTRRRPQPAEVRRRRRDRRRPAPRRRPAQGRARPRPDRRRE